MAEYLFRLDDIAPNMDWDRYKRLRDLFREHNVCPLLAVVPQNEDPEFLKYPPVPINFWDEVRERQAGGWHIGLHGYRHRYDSTSPGLLGISKRSEFAGHSFAEQLDRLRRGKEIFEREKVRIDAFVAPSHSYDSETLRALKEIGVRVVSDGFALFPYIEDDLLFIPQLVEHPRTFPFGVHTFCLHPNTMNNFFFERVRLFIEQNRDSIITLEQAKERTSKSIWNRVMGSVSRAILKLKRAVAN